LSEDEDALPVFFSGLDVSPNEEKYLLSYPGLWIEKNASNHVTLKVYRYQEVDLEDGLYSFAKANYVNNTHRLFHYGEGLVDPASIRNHFAMVIDSRMLWSLELRSKSNNPVM